jgi:putative nucleotidyltransferase with HDIG domain
VAGSDNPYVIPFKKPSELDSGTDLDSPRLMELVEKLRDIPTLSVVVQKVMELVNNPRTSAPQIADVLKRDQVLTAKVLRLVNSSFYNLSTEVTDVSKALGFLGFNSVSMLVLGTSVFSSFDIAAADYFNVREFWKHSLATAIAAELIAKKTKRGKPEEAFTCGLLHDMGKIALFKISPRDLRAAVELAAEKNISLLDAESELGLPGHSVLGERLAEKWQLPVVIRKVIRFHHRDIEPLESIYPQMRPMIMITTLANIMSKRLDLGKSGDTLKPEYPLNYMKALAITQEGLQEVEKQMETEIERAQGFLSASMTR